jgi:3-oxoadipate enol-lactonase
MPADGADVIKGLAPHGQIVRFEEVAHFIPYQAPDRFVETLRPFLATADW